MEKESSNNFKGIYSKKINLNTLQNRIKKESKKEEKDNCSTSINSMNTYRSINTEKDNIPTFIIDFNKNEKKYKPLSRQRNNSFNNLRKTTEEIPISLNINNSSKDDFQNLSSLNNTTLSNLKTNFTIRRKVDEAFRCSQCPLIPFLNLEINNKEILISEKCENNHYNKLNLRDFIEKNRKNNLNEVKCCKCQKFQKTEKVPFSYCRLCNLFFCNECTINHSWQHNLITSNELDSMCYNHVEKFIYFCEKCNKNLCSKCYREHNKNFPEHEIILLGKKFLSEIELSKIKNKLIKEESLIIYNKEKVEKKIEELNNIINEIKINYEYYKEVIENKIIIIKKLLSIYNNGIRQQNLNFEIIQNIRNTLNFNFNIDFTLTDNLIKNNFVNLNISNQNNFSINGICMEEKKIEINNDFSLSLYNEIENMRQSVLNCEIGVNTEEYINYNLNNNKKNEFKINLKKKRSKSFSNNLQCIQEIKENVFAEKKEGKFEINNFGSINFFSQRKMDNYSVQKINNESFILKSNKCFKDYFIVNNNILIEGNSKNFIFKEENCFYEIKGIRNYMFKNLKEEFNKYFELLSSEKKSNFENLISNINYFNILGTKKKIIENINEEQLTTNNTLIDNKLLKSQLYFIEINNQLSIFGNDVKNNIKEKIFNILDIENKVNCIEIININKYKILSIINFNIEILNSKIKDLTIDSNINYEIIGEEQSTNKKNINSMFVDYKKTHIFSIETYNNIEILNTKKQNELSINSENMKNIRETSINNPQLLDKQNHQLLFIENSINNIEIINIKKPNILFIDSNINKIEIVNNHKKSETNINNSEIKNIKNQINLSTNSINIEILNKPKTQIKYSQNIEINIEIKPHKKQIEYLIEYFNIELKSKIKNFAILDFTKKNNLKEYENSRYSNTSSLSDDKYQILKINNNQNYLISKETNISYETPIKNQNLNVSNKSNNKFLLELNEKPISSLSFRERLEKFDKKNINVNENISYISSISSKDKTSSIQRYQMINEHIGNINCLIEIKNQDFISCSDDKTIKLFDSNNYYQNKLSLTPHSQSIIYLLKLNDDFILSCSLDKNIKLIQLSNNNNYSIIKQTISIHSEKINKMILLKNNQIASCGSDSLILIFDFNQRENCLMIFKKIISKSFGIDNIIECEKYNNLYAFSEKSNLIEIYDNQNYELKNKIESINYIGGNNGVIIYKDDYLIFCEINGISILNLLNNQIEKKFDYKTSYNYLFNCLIFIRNEYLFGGGIETIDNKKKIIIKIWRVENKDNNIILEDFDIKNNPHSKPIFCFLELSNKKIVTGSEDSSIKIWDFHPEKKAD